MGLSKEMELGKRERALGVLTRGFDGGYKRPLDILEKLQDFESEKGLFDRVRESNFSGMITELRRKDGELVEDVIPYLIEFGANNDGKDSMQLECFSKEEGIIKVDMNDLTGFEVVLGEDKESSFEEKDELLLEFEYINSGNQKREGKKRRVRVLDLAYGVHGKPLGNDGFSSHKGLGERPDFYLVGQDTQYIQNSKAKDYGIRQFPFWRVFGQRGGSISELNKQSWFGGKVRS